MDPTLRQVLRQHYRADERECLLSLLDAARLDGPAAAAVRSLALRLVEGARARAGGGVEALLVEYDLSSREGVLLMCLAEALLRIPDRATAERLIHDKLVRGEWDRHLGHSDSLLVNASTWGLLLTGRVLDAEADAPSPLQQLHTLVARLGEAAARLALRQAMEVLAGQFVMGESLAAALRQAPRRPGLRYSFDCLGEAALTAADAGRYFDAYLDAIHTLGRRTAGGDPVEADGVSIKLSALHPRYEYRQAARIHDELYPRLATLARAARDAGIALTLDAEEADRLELSLDLFERLVRDPALAGWDGLGLAVQAYQKRAVLLVRWLAALAAEQGRRIRVRLVKGAYWDAEIKRAQQRGLDGYPVFTRKAATDLSYLACARELFAAGDTLYPQFATHNAYTVACVLELAGGRRDFEFQRLHGMGEPLYEALAQETGTPVPCRVYAPVGSHDRLLPYLVRRLLENGANTSFVHKLLDPDTPPEQLVEDPVARLQAVDCMPHPRIVLPRDLYQPDRLNAQGLDLSDPLQREPLLAALAELDGQRWQAPAIIGGEARGAAERPVLAPRDRTEQVGLAGEADDALVDQALAVAAGAAAAWAARPVQERADILLAAADRIEADRAALVSLCVREGGRCIPDALDEVREAVDYCRYYAARAREQFPARPLPGPTGEDNRLSLHGRGPFACISPWNFPIAIFTGQVVAALVAGNSVIAKPARQTPLTAARLVGLLHQAGVPGEVLNLLPGSGARIGARLLADPRLAGVVFTGSTDTAWTLQDGLARRRGPILPFIAETGGQNALIVDSSALPEQVVADVLTSAFNSAGQRCSALRVLFVQDDIADTVQDMLAGALDELRVGDPMRLDTDVGPVIDPAARDALQAHADALEREGRLIARAALPGAAGQGVWFAPQVFALDDLRRLGCEVFGPVLHLLRYRAGELDAVVDAVNATGYGLTLGVHSRIEATWRRVAARARVGNVYINRDLIGAVVGVQPFGGEGLSGTGPKAGGPHYLQRFAVERTLTVNTAAVGGNAGLLSLDD